jgi:uncharacterized membrane protein YbaN (DUF454 family)
MRILAAPAFSARATAGPDGYHVVHSSYGRVRVHLADWSGSAAEELIAHLRTVPGVISVRATATTQNVLILHDPRLCSLAVLLAKLGDAWQQKCQQSMENVRPLALFSPEPLPVFQRTTAHNDTRPAPVYVTGWRRTLYKILGWASVGMAVVGILPGIPSAPFVILAGYFFIRSSPAAHEWLLGSRWFGPLLRDWEEHQAVRRSVRNLAVGLLCCCMVIITLIGLPVPLVLIILALQFSGLIIVLRLRVVEQPSSTPALIAP